MLNKLLGGQKLKPFFRRHVFREEGKPPEKSCPSVPPALIRIVHVGGVVEHFYMAVPAAGVMEKYPSFVLARPDIFRLPWESVVGPEEILLPGQKYYVIPCRTVRKLRRRIRPRSREEFSIKSSSWQSTDVSSGDEPENPSKDGFSWSSVAGVKREEKRSARAALRLGEEHRRRTAKKTVSWEPSLTVISES